MSGRAKRAAPRARVRLLDGLRGFSVVSMVAYHALYDVVYLFGYGAYGGFGWYTGIPGYVWQQSICWVFILVAGAALHHSRRPLRHGAVVLGCAMALTVGTAIFMPGMRILFGVLHLLGLCMVLAGVAMPLLRRVPAGLGLVVSAGLFCLLRGLPRGFIGFLDVPVWAVPPALYRQSWLFWLGLPGPGFFSSDYFPLVPWLFLFLAGYFLWVLVKHRFAATAPGRSPLEWVGRHSLIIYMLHQPLVYALLWALRAAGWL